jgi:hypothetical protein
MRVKPVAVFIAFVGVLACLCSPALAAPPTHTISGVVATADGTGVEGVDVAGDNGATSAVTVADGSYSITVSNHWDGTVTVSKAGWLITPPSNTYTNVSDDIPGQNYTAYQPKISGYVTKSDGTPLPGSTVTANNGGGNATTDATGYYELNIPYNWTGTVSATLAGYAFTDKNYTSVITDQANQNFSGFQPTISGSTGVAGATVTVSGVGTVVSTPDYTVTVPYGWSGTITAELAGYDFTNSPLSYANVTTGITGQNFTPFQPTISGSTGITGATVTVSGVGSVVSTPEYSMTVPYGWSGTVEASLTGYGFPDSPRNYTNVTVNQVNQDFTPYQPTISGSTNVAGATVTISGIGVIASTPDYTVTVPYGWSGTVTAELAGYDFTNSPLSYTNVTTNQTNQNFTPFQPTITGSTGVAGATVIVSGVGSVISSPEYSVTVPYGWSGTIEASLAGYHFPESPQSYTDVTTNHTNQVFTPYQPTISGTVTKGDGSPVSGVAVTADNGGGSDITDASGDYEIILPYGWNGTVNVSRLHWAIVPESRAYSNVTSDQAEQNYMGTYIGINGSGTQEDPYIIGCIEDFQVFCADSAYWDGYARLECDLDLSSVATYSRAPIAPDIDDTNYKIFDGPAYTGSFDGNGHVISNLSVSGAYFVGLFGCLGSDSEIKNLKLTGVTINCSVCYAGSLAGYNEGADISACSSTGKIVTDDYSGGLIGRNDSGNILNCYSSITLNGYSSVGGLVGYNSTGSIVDSYSTGFVNGGWSSGGLIGINDSGNISNCYSSVRVVSFSDSVGGLVGYLYSGVITNCFSTGSVSGEYNVGGFAGCNYGDISGCYSTGSVTGDEEVGGLVGFMNSAGSISNSYSMGEVTGGYEVGGLVGSSNYGTTTNSYSTGKVNGSFNTGGLSGFDHAGHVTNSYYYVYSGVPNGYGVPLDDSQLLDQFSFEGFDFVDSTADGIEDHWIIEPGYMPRLSWQESPGFEAPRFLDEISTNLNGTGYPNDPFIISSRADLIEFRNNSSLRIGHYSLTNDIDLLGLTYPEAFIPEYFYGSFAGNGHKISNLTINGGWRVGFFSSFFGSVYDLRLEDVSISTAGSRAGALIGYNGYGSVSKCYAMGVVNGDRESGGLVGENECGEIANSCTDVTVIGLSNIGGMVGYNSGSNIINCYSIGSVSGIGTVGGLVGLNPNSTIASSYSIGAVAGDSYAGGLVGREDFWGGDVVDSYFYICNGPVSSLGVPLDHNQIKDQLSYEGFDFVGNNLDGTADIWVIEPNYLPRLSWQDSPGIKSPFDNIVTNLSGSGYSGDPYLIANYDDLMEFRNNSAFRVGDYSLISNIDLTGLSITEAFVAEDFHGNFSGNGHIVSNLAISGESNLGFFSNLHGCVDNLVLDNVSIVGTGDYVGALAAQNHGGSIKYCYSIGDVSGAGYYTGGLVGLADNGGIESSYSTGTVGGMFYVGGIIGKNASGNIDTSYSNVIVEGTNYVGGLAGLNEGNINNCYSVGEVSGNSSVGGLIGYHTGVTNACYSAATVTGNYSTGGLIGREHLSNITNTYFYAYGGVDNGHGLGLDDYQLQDQYSFAGFDFVGSTDDGIGDYWEIEPGYMPRLSWQEGTGFEPPFVLEKISTSLKGNGTVSNPFILENYDDLMEFRSNSALRIGNYSLKSDVDLTGEIYSEAFILEDFRGSFAGNGHVVSGLNIEGAGNVGFFSKLEHASVGNLVLQNLSVSGTGDYIGGLAGSSGSDVIIEDCNIESGHILGNAGLVGLNYGVIRNCHSIDVWVEGIDVAGGLVGDNRGIITDSSASGTVVGGFLTGGLVGTSIGGDQGSISGGGYVENCWSSCNVQTLGIDSRGNSGAGGLIGRSYSDISQCYAIGMVTGVDYVGGLIGFIGYHVNAYDSYTRSDVTGTGQYVGGFCGAANGGNTIANCYSAGSVSGTTQYIGGFVGGDVFGALLPDYQSCFWNIDKNSDKFGIGDGTRSDPNVIGETTANMQSKAIYLEWDFIDDPNDGTEDIWAICEGTNYPRLTWQIPAGDYLCPDGVALEDYSFFAQHWLQTDYGTAEGAELTGDGFVGIDDLLALTDYWLLFGCGDCDGRDMTGEGNVDLSDLSYMAQRWQQSDYGDCGGAELTGDGVVDIDDFMLFCENWLVGIE